jgi:hypothetical protein
MKNLSFLSCAKAATLSAIAILAAGQAFAGGQAGATLQASKTIDICVQQDGQWRYSGAVSVWNEGAADTQGLQINDCIQSKVSGPVWTNNYCAYLTQGGVVVIPGYTAEVDATVFPYSTANAALAGSIRNDASVQITNHSGHPLGQLFGPEPKATYTGSNPPPACATDAAQCTYSQGYWANKPGVVWPSPYDRNALFYISGSTWNDVANNPGGSGYNILAVQYIAAVLNAANGSPVPGGIQDVLNQANTWFTTHTSADCTTGKNGNGNCSLQITWGGILESYNLGAYPGSPGHCGEQPRGLQPRE